MMALVPLFAGWGEVIIPLLVMIFWVVSQIMGNRPAKPARGRGPANPPDDAPDQVDLRKEIESFLKQAAGGKEKVETAEEVKAPPPQRQRIETPVEAVVLADSGSEGPSQRLTSRHAVSSHVEEHLDTQDIADHASHLADDLGQTDERLEARLHAKFDHSLGKLKQIGSKAESETSEAESSIAAEIVHVFRNPHEVRRAIILNEILTRPDDRW